MRATLLVLMTVLLFGPAFEAVAQTPGTFNIVGDMIRPRFLHTSTLLPDGRVLIAGGDSCYCGITEASVELYDPSKGTFTATGIMTTPRHFHSATLLPNGKILIAGGEPRFGADYSLASAELYDVATGTFVATGSMTVQRMSHTATLLNNGKVLIAGGFRRLGSTSQVDYPITAELYDPSTGTFTATGNMTSGWADTATLLPSGKVLITRSDPDGILHASFFSEIYDPSTGLFSPSGKMATFDTGPTATSLTNAGVLIAGGDVGDGDGASFDAELYDPLTDMFTVTGNLTTRREQNTATLLPDGTVLFAGGHGGVPVPGGGYDNVASAELYDPNAGVFRPTGGMVIGRDLHDATLLNDGKVLITGGNEYYPAGAGGRDPQHPVVSIAEVYTPAVLVPLSIVTDLQFDPMSVVAGSSYSATVSGSNLAPDTFFDVRFFSPGSNESAVLLNWQRGLVETHDVPVGIASGAWTINGVRAHRVETDHTGGFASVSATITVSP
jgi:hypothetical protein